MAHIFTITEKIGDTVISQYDTVVSKWVSLDDIPGVTDKGNGSLTNPLKPEESFRMLRLEASDAVVSAVLASNPEIVLTIEAGASSQTTPKTYQIEHKESGWYWQITMNPQPGSTEYAQFFCTAYWGGHVAGNTYGGSRVYTPQNMKIKLAAVSKKDGTPSKDYFGLMFCRVAGTYTVSGSPVMTGEGGLFGAQSDPLPETTTHGGGGFGTHDNRTDVTVNIGTKGSGFLSGLLGSGFNLYYVPDYSDLIRAAYYSLNGVNNLSDFVNNTAALFLSPSTYIVSAAAIPLDKSAFGAGTIQHTIRLGGLIGFNVDCYPLSSVWGDSDVYTYDFDGMYYDSYLDFEPYTKVTLFLPYIGFVPLKASECVGGQISVQYRFEAITGKCVAFVKTTDRNGRNTGFYQYNGDGGYSLPWVGNNGGGSQMIHSAASAAISIAKGSKDPVGDFGAFLSEAASFSANDSRPHMQGGFGVNTGALGADEITLFIQRAQHAMPENYYDVHGYQTATGGTVGDYTGFTQFAFVELSDCAATDAEKAEIESLLKGGVYL